MKRERGTLWAALRGLLAPAVAVVAVLCLSVSVSNLQTGRNDAGRRQLEDSLRRAAVTCYATEGVYPPTLEYVEDHYGIQVDTGRYTVDYQIFADNLMPDITVLENED